MGLPLPPLIICQAYTLDTQRFDGHIRFPRLPTENGEVSKKKENEFETWG